MAMDQATLDLAARELPMLMTPGYRPSTYGFGLGMSLQNGLPPFSMDIVDAMRRDYQVKLAMTMKVVPVMKPLFAITGDPEVVEFVKNELRSIWTSSITDMTEAMWYTRFACEMVYKKADGDVWRFARMMPYHPRDFSILTKNGEITGAKIIASSNSVDIAGNGKVISSSAVDDSNKAILFAPKCFVYVHDKKFGSFDGMSELEGAYPSWMEKTREGGAVASRSLWGYKCMFDSGMIIHPEGSYTDELGRQIPYRDFALKIGEAIRNGSVVAVPGITDAGGNRLWDWIRPEINSGGQALMALIDHLDGKINKGCGIPDDVIEQVSGTGSYAGRTIPFIAFLEAGTPTVRNISRELCRQVLVPLTQVNFGESRGKDWEITEAGVNTKEFLGDAKSTQKPGNLPGDGDGDGIPNEAQQQMSLESVSRFADKLNLSGMQRKRFSQAGIGGGFSGPRVAFEDEPRRKVLRAKQVQMSVSHDVSQEKRDAKGRWTGGNQGRKIDSTEFMRWFGDSKVRDSEGEPLVVYHGTNRQFDAFDSNATKSNKSGESGFYLTPSKRQASAYGSNVMPVYAAISNPLVIQDKSEIAPHGLTQQHIADLKKAGYDGIVVVPDGESLSKADEVIPFHPSQIKSIHNHGDFDPANHSLQMSVADQPRDEFGRWTSGHSSFSGKLPKNREKLHPIDATQAVNSMGFHVGLQHKDPETGRTVYKVLNSRGEVKHLNADELRNLAYSTPDESGKASATEIMDTIHKIEPAAWRGALIGSRELREAVGEKLSKAEFDSKILEMARNGELSLHHHDYASSLSDAERDELISYPVDQGDWMSYDGRKYVVGVAVRPRQMSLHDVSDEARDSDGKWTTGGKSSPIGHGSTGDVHRVGDSVHKNASKTEARVYDVISGVDGVSPGRLEGQKIVTPYYPHVVSVDTIEQKRRHNLAPLIKPNLSRIVNAITALSESGHDYNDPIQIGLDSGRKSHLIDFSNASRAGDEAVRSNLSHLASFLGQFGLGRHADGVGRIADLWDYVNDPDMREFDSDSEESKDAAKVSTSLDGDKAKYAYYSFNAREIKGLPQTEYRDGIKAVFTSEPLSDKRMSEWELHPAVHRTDSDTHQMGQGRFAWDEDEHPRDHGKFSSKPGASGIADEPFSLKREKSRQFKPKNSSGEQADLYSARKATHSPADDAVKPQVESLPGQKMIDDEGEIHGPHHVTKTPAFKAWFGDWESDPENASKVVDSAGQPQKTGGTGIKEVYHGTMADFEVFDKTLNGKNASMVGEGFYFSENKAIADSFAKAYTVQNGRPVPKRGKVISAYLAIRKPFDFDQVASKDDISKWANAANELFGDKFQRADFIEKCNKSLQYSAKSGKPTTNYDLWRHAADSCWQGTKDVNKIPQQLGYDGLTHQSRDERGAPWWQGSTEPPHGRVWIAFEPTQIKATANTGTFDPSNPNIQMSQSTPEQSGRWITIGGHEGSGDKGGCKVFIGRNGRILKGPAGLKGENLKTLGDKDSKESREARAAHAKAQGKTGHDLTEQEARKLGSKAHVTAHAHAKDEARMAGVSTHDVLQNMPEAHKYRLEQHGQREHAKTRARAMTGMNAGNLAKFENTYKDYSTVPGFDTAARTIAMEHPELGLDPDGDETAPAVWELIREGKVEEPKLHDRETARQAAEWINQARRHHKVATKHDPIEDTSFNFGFGHDQLGEGETPFIDFSQNTDGDQ